MTKNRNRNVVYFFCDNRDKDHVGPRVLEAILAERALEPTDLQFDRKPVVKTTDQFGNAFYLARTSDVLSHCYEQYLEEMNSVFGDFDFGAIINWHEGRSAPNQIFCVHSTAEVKTGYFGPTDGRLTRAMVLAVEAVRSEQGLTDFATMIEATHWSGIPYGSNPSLVPKFAVPLIDVEIGSSPTCWADPLATKVLSASLFRLFEFEDESAPVVLMLGGMHIASSWADIVLSNSGAPLAPTHVLGNQWMADYEGADGLEKLLSAARSARDDVDAIVFHAKLPGRHKELARTLAATLGVPALSHKSLKNKNAIAPLAHAEDWNGK